MSGKEHYGPPGSFKTSGCVQDDFIPEIKTGRTVVTNIRGLNDRQKVKDLLKLDFIPRLFHLDTSTHAGKEKMRRWFHWCPKGALLMVDEINTIYPKEWTARKLAEYDYPGSYDAAALVNRPCTASEAFEMHRHYGWDFVVTTPSHNRVHNIVKDVTEAAYRHQNKALFGFLFKSRYSEIFHEPDTRGRTKEDQLDFRIKRIKPLTFKLYKSTATGQVSDTRAGINFFTSPLFIIWIVCMILGGTFLYNMGPPKVVQSAYANATDLENDKSEKQNEPVALEQKRKQPTKQIRQKQVLQDPERDYVTSFKYSLMAYMEWDQSREKRVLFYAYKNGERSVLTSKELLRLKVTYESLGHCLGKMRYKGEVFQIVNCKREQGGNTRLVMPDINPINVIKGSG